jgi:hypothetical protein
METLCFSETLSTDKSSWCQNPEEQHLQMLEQYPKNVPPLLPATYFLIHNHCPVQHCITNAVKKVLESK